MKKHKITLIILGIIALVGFTVYSQLLKPGKYDKEITKTVSYILKNSHFSNTPFDEALSEKVFYELFYNLDYNKRYFIESDIQKLDGFRDILHLMLAEGDLTFPLQAYKIYMKRLEERVEYVQQRFQKPFDFTKDIDYVYDRTKSPWMKNKEELNALWYTIIKHEILSIEYLQKKKRDKLKKKKKKKTDKEILAYAKKKILKRYKNFLKKQKENGSDFILELILNSLAKSLDPHSNYAAPKAMEEFEISMSLKLTGIGAQLTLEDGYTKITRIIPGGPADKDKRLQPGDRLVSVVSKEGEKQINLIDMNLSKVVSYIRGKKGTKVVLTVLKGGINGARVDIDLIRDVVKLKDAEAKGKIKTIRDKKIGLIYVPSFYADFAALRDGKDDYKNCTDDVRKILQEQIKKGIDGLVLDMRGNGGGSLTEAIRMTGLFIKSGPVVQVKTSGGRVNVRKDDDKAILYSGPLVVLVDSGSASATEIFAAAIQDYGRGIITGTITHGKGTVQQVLPLSRIGRFKFIKGFNPGQVKYTMAKFYRISGGSTQKKGVSPDIVMPSYNDFSPFGEKTLRNVLPWDHIPKAPFQKHSEVKKYLKKLKTFSKERQEKSKNFQALKEDLKYYKEIIDRKTITVNREKRNKLRKYDKKNDDKRKELKKLFWPKSENINEKIIDNIYLQESEHVLVDLIDMESVNQLNSKK